MAGAGARPRLTAAVPLRAAAAADDSQGEGSESFAAWLLASFILTGGGQVVVEAQHGDYNSTEAGLTDAEISTHKWAATIAFLALQTTNFNETSAVVVVEYLEFLTLTAIYNVYNGSRFYAAHKVQHDVDNVNLPQSASDLADRISEVPQRGIEALVQSSPGNATQLFNGLLTVTDPVLFSDSSAQLRASAVGAIVAATGISYNPCVVAVGPVGALLVAQAIGISPQLITVGPSGAVLVALGLNINPTLINIGPAGNPNIVAAFSVSPSLISIQPTVAFNISVAQSIGTAAKTENVIPRPPPKPTPWPTPKPLPAFPPLPGPSPSATPKPLPPLPPLPDKNETTTGM